LRVRMRLTLRQPREVRNDADLRSAYRPSCEPRARGPSTGRARTRQPTFSRACSPTRPVSHLPSATTSVSRTTSTTHSTSTSTKMPGRSPSETLLKT
jgi:hypothetical protein